MEFVRDCVLGGFVSQLRAQETGCPAKPNNNTTNNNNNSNMRKRRESKLTAVPPPQSQTVMTSPT